MATRSENGRGVDILAMRDKRSMTPGSMWWAKQRTPPARQRVGTALSTPLPTLRRQTLGVRSQCQRWG
jgi:hypothetical protein